MMRTRRFRSFVWVPALALAVAGTACSGGDEDTAAPSRTAGAEPGAETPAEATVPEAPAEAVPPAAAPADPTMEDAAGAARSSGEAPSAARRPTAAGPAKAATTAPAGHAPEAAPPASSSPAPAAPAAPAPKAGQAPAPGPAPGGDPAEDGVVPVDALPAPDRPGDKANYASDIGVSGDVIRIGSINLTSASRSLGPPIAGTQENTLHAVVNYINSTGGVAGRRVELALCDDGGDIARGRACYERLKGEVFALMPSISWLTDVIHDSLKSDKLPWMTWGWFKSEYQDPWMFPCHANGEREAIALANWIAKVMVPKGVATIGIMYLNVSEDINATRVFEKAVKPSGVKTVAKIAQEWDSPDESQHVLQMRSADPDMVVAFSWPAPVAKFLHDADTQRYEPKHGYVANHLTGDPGFGPVFGEYIKDRMYTITSWATPIADSASNPEGDSAEQRLHADEMRRTNGMEFQGFKWRYYGGHHITQSAWVCGRIFQKAAAELGPDLTREGLKRVLESRGWDSGMGNTLYWPKGDHNALPYSFNREFIYKWTGHPDGGWDFERILPDPVYDCRAGNIPAGATTICDG